MQALGMPVVASPVEPASTLSKAVVWLKADAKFGISFGRFTPGEGAGDKRYTTHQHVSGTDRVIFYFDFETC
jgi:hypothetical protein